jgi:hypothetical protein
MVAAALAAMGFVVTLTVVETAPAATVTVAGTVAAAVLLEVSVTVIALDAVPFKVIVATEVAPPTTLAGLRVTDCGPGVLIVKRTFAELTP